jgi:hypothetical protein
MDDKITIIEGPPPTFEAVNQEWVSSLNESPSVADIALTRLRTFNGPALVERCHRAWRQQQTMHLEFRNSEGLDQAVPIVAARSVEIEDGQMLMLWVRLNQDQYELETRQDDNQDDDLDDDFGLQDI